MQTTSRIEPTLEPGVKELVRRHNAEAAFQTACDMARSSFLEMRSFNVELLDDPDEDGRVWVLLNVLVPRSYPPEALHQEELRFHEGLVTRVPLELNPLFGLSVRFQPE